MRTPVANLATKGDSAGMATEKRSHLARSNTEFYY